jgi:5-methylthioadenosine/S-adenosylhomocysteine deaminase
MRRETRPAPTQLLLKGGRVLDLDGDIHRPAYRDVCIIDGRIAAIDDPAAPSESAREILRRAEAGEPGFRVIDASDRLIVPGFVNAHYHSYDVLAKGMLEDMPFDIWALLSQPAYWGKRSKAELRARTLIGAIECLKNGITTLQDMNSLVPQDEETLDIILSAYAELGIRVVFSIGTCWRKRRAISAKKASTS